MNFKIAVIQSYALNDVVHLTEWESGKRLITEQARYSGRSADGSIHFFVRRWNEPQKETEGAGRRSGAVTMPKLPSIPAMPVQYAVTISTSGKSPAAVALWRLGDGDNFKCVYYLVGDSGELLEVKRPEEAPEPPKNFVGFHHPGDADKM